MADHLRRDGSPVRYAAIDQFEMGGGAVRLMDFHRALRSADVRPHVYPETIAAGLASVARTIGGVDLILVDVNADFDAGQLTDALARVSHEATRLLVQTADGWSQTEIVRRDLRVDPAVRIAA